ncbi:hypothetical protein [Tropicimonas sp. IMCC34043]|uniref:hypothetical protein n=1 Tax=Tropicimonas sp. IMCC34043 TaxID=2248760 RepID=UPI000E244503|nr:hypothetical protein [Tropicimonas sp. IMCC34043]
MKSVLSLAGLAAFLSTLAASSASATTVTQTVGDADCFGLGAGASECAAGAFATIPSFDNSSPGDPAGTDVLGTLGTVTLAFGPLDLGGLTATSASVEIRVAGIDIYIEPSGGGDANVGATFALNGTLIGTYHEPVVIGSTINQRAITTLTFSIDLGDLNFGSGNVLAISPESDFGLAQYESYAIDYASLTVVTADTTAPVPLPASAPLLGAAALALAVAAARRRARR